MATWAPIASMANLQDSGTLNLYIHALNQRLNVLGFTLLPAVTAGTNIQELKFWTNENGTDGLQALALYITPAFLDDQVAYAANANRDVFTGWTIPGIRSRAGLPATKFYIGSHTANATESTFFANTLMRRQRPREILSTTAVRDAQGNPSLAGQYARYIGDSSSGPASSSSWVLSNRNYSGRGYLMKCFGAGDWRYSPDNGPVDILDNTRSPPFCISEQNTNFSAGRRGLMYFGDYIFSHIFNEIYAIVDQLRWTWDIIDSQNVGGHIYTAYRATYPVTIVSNSRRFYQGLSPDAATEAGAEAATLANYAPATLPDDYLPFASNVKALLTGATPWRVNAYRGDAKYVKTFPVAASSIYRKQVWYNYAQTPSRTNEVFDNNGDSVAAGLWTAWNTVGVTTASPYTTPVDGNAPVYPVNAGVPAGTPPVSGAKDYVVDRIAAVYKWNVDGGFSEVTVTV